MPVEMHERNDAAETLPLRPGRWRLDQNHSSVWFTIRHLGVSKVRGRFRQFDADLVVGPTAAECHVEASVALTSIDTGIESRDDQVRSADYLDVERRLTMRFRSTAIAGTGSSWTLEGVLEIGDVSRPFVLDVELGGVEPFLDGTRHAGFEATGELRRRDFGIAPGPGGAMLGDLVKVELDLQFIEPTP